MSRSRRIEIGIVVTLEDADALVAAALERVEAKAATFNWTSDRLNAALRQVSNDPDAALAFVVGDRQGIEALVAVPGVEFASTTTSVNDPWPAREDV